MHSVRCNRSVNFGRGILYLSEAEIAKSARQSKSDRNVIVTVPGKRAHVVQIMIFLYSRF